MKKRLLRQIYITTALAIFIVLVSGAYTNTFAQASAPQRITNNFGKEAETSRNFTWSTEATIQTGLIQYCALDQFFGFDKDNIETVESQNYETQTDLYQSITHKVELVGLNPGTDYVYRVGSNESFSAQGHFRTAGNEPSGFTFIGVTDTQGSNDNDYAVWKKTLAAALSKFPDARFLVHTGDMVDDGQKINQWNLFQGAVANELMNLPIAPAVGNHDVFNGNKTNSNAKNFTDAFNLPKELNTGAPLGTVYSYDYGNVHIAVMNTEVSNADLIKQAEWLRQDMTGSNKTWKIVALHRGPYGATYDSAHIRNAWTPAFDDLGIDLVLQGHDHNYVRSYTMKNGVKANDGKGTLYLTGNAGGVKFYPLKPRAWQKVNIQPKLQMYIAVTVSNDEMLIQAYDVKNTLRDSVTLSKTAPGSDILNHWAKQSIQNWQDKGFITGYPDGSFKPNDDISRAEFMTLINKAFKYTAITAIRYSDVKTGDWYANEVAIAEAAGYISGYPDGTLRPNNPISREEAASIIMKINELFPNVEAANSFTDASNLLWSKGAVGAVVTSNIMIGYPDGSFHPQKLIKRGEATVGLYRANEQKILLYESVGE